MTNPTPPDFDALAQQVTGAWPQVVAAWEEFRITHKLRLLADLGDSDPHGFLVDALGIAYARRRFRALHGLFDERGLLAPAFTTLAAPILAGGFALQAHVNGTWRVQYGV